MRKFMLIFLLVSFLSDLSAQNILRPKLVVGFVVDQMRWDFLYRYYERYTPNGGFKRLLGQGFSCENAFIPYAPTVTGPGHASIYTGSVPAINGITGNAWFDNIQQKNVYCTEDSTVNTVGGEAGSWGQQSPANLLTTTFCDELKLATNFKSKVIGIAIKDRGGILAAGHSADASYWYDSKTGNWITSTYYMNDLPTWVKNFNNKKLVDNFYKQGWTTLYPLNTYIQSTSDIKPYELNPLGKSFPYDMKAFAGKNYGIIASTPYGNTLTLEMAKESIAAEGLGQDAITDVLAVSLSSPDYIGHSFGPNSIEQEDDFLRLDKELGEFLTYLDTKVGKGQYLFFLSADHGAAHVPGFLNEHKIPAGKVNPTELINNINSHLKQRFNLDNAAVSIYNYQVNLDNGKIDNAKADIATIRKSIIDYLTKLPYIARAFENDKLGEIAINEKVKKMMANGYYPKRSGDIQFVLLPHWIEGFVNGGTTHGLWNPYDSHIPLIWYGWKVKAGKSYKEVYMTDIAPTIAAMLHIQMPSGSVGNVIAEVIKD